MANVATRFATAVETIMRFADQTKIKLISKLIKGISKNSPKIAEVF